MSLAFTWLPPTCQGPGGIERPSPAGALLGFTDLLSTASAVWMLRRAPQPA